MYFYKLSDLAVSNSSLISSKSLMFISLIGFNSSFKFFKFLPAIYEGDVCIEN